jgi:hypothetical protein
MKDKRGDADFPGNFIFASSEVHQARPGWRDEPFSTAVVQSLISAGTFHHQRRQLWN